MKKLGFYCLIALIGVLLGYLFTPNEPIIYTEVVVPAARIIEREPRVEIRFRDRIVYNYITPRQVAVAPGGAINQVRAFCRPQVVLDTDTVHTVDTLVLVRSFVHNPGWFLGKDNLVVTTASSVGDLSALDYKVRPGFSGIAVGNTVQVRYPRTAVLRESAEFVVVGTVGALLGIAIAVN